MITKKNTEFIYPLTPLQEGILFHWLYDRNSRAYVEQTSYRIRGHHDFEKLRESLQQLTQRHGVFRTVFSYEKTQRPLQIVLKEVVAAFAHHDIRSYNQEEQRRQLADFREVDRARGFDLTQDRLIRLTVFQLGIDTYEFVWTHHHILMDGWCLGIVVGEFMSFYAGLLAGNIPVLESVAPYGNYIAWLQARDRSVSAAYWHRYLVGYEQKAGFPRKRNRREGYAPAWHEVTVSRSVVTLLKEMCSRSQITINTAFQALWGVLLSKYNNVRDVVYGSVVSGRPAQLAGVEQMIGLFINTVPVRVQYRVGDTFELVAQELQATWGAGEEHHYHALAEIQSGTDLKQDLLDHILIFENYPLSDQLASGQTGFVVEGIEVFEQTHYDLNVIILPGEEMRIRFSYNAHVYEDDIIRSVGNYLLHLLDQVLVNVLIAVNRLEVLPVAARAAILHPFEKPGTLHSDKTVHAMFIEQARLYPDAVAIRCSTGDYTYGELDLRSTQLAHRLRESGVARDGVVGLWTDRSYLMVVGLLGILKAGGAYLPLDPAYPSERLSHMLSDSGCSFLLTDHSTSSPLSFAGTTLYLDDARHYSDRTDPLEDISRVTDLVYIIYTSGSTGRPKGVMIDHRAVFRFFNAVPKDINLSGVASVLATTSLSFDISVLEILWPLCNGMRVHLNRNRFELFDAGGSGNKKTAISLLFFSSYSSQEGDSGKYQLLLDVTRKADAHGLKAVWTPERHFHAFGGLYPNPSVVSAALAMITKNIQIRSGSVVLPLHDPIRVAEDWSVVDNLSNGRVGVSFAAGWQPNDFALMPTQFDDRYATMYESIRTVRALWAGEEITRVNGLNQTTRLRIYPRPVQKNLPVWITCSGNPETFRKAGELGAHVLTHMLGQTAEQLRENVTLYRQSLADHGFSPDVGGVSLMLHTYITEDVAEIDTLVKGPFMAYLESSIGLGKLVLEQLGIQPEDLSSELKEQVLENAFRRYVRDSSLIGSVDDVTARILKFKDDGIDEFACLIDFGVEQEKVMARMDNLIRINTLLNQAGTGDAMHADLVQMTPSYLKMFLESPGMIDYLKRAKVLLLGGEELPLALLRHLQSQVSAKIYNVYGPTEATIWASVADVTTEDHITIGKPFSNTEMFVLNHDRQLQPTGVAGEIHIGGQSLSRGYFQQAELTDAKFVDHPFRTQGKLYRTGDLGRLMPDGKIEFLGRSDSQVKVRGHRVELSEIESAIRETGLVSEVRTVFDASLSQINAYVVHDTTVDEKLLRKALAVVLPGYMIPSVFVQLDVFPLTANGKIDRTKLPALSSAPATRVLAHATTAVEQKVLQIWKDVLGIESIGVDENFFEVGGHSLKVIQISNRVVKEFTIEIPLVTFFTNVTIRQLAEVIEARLWYSNPAVEEASEQYKNLTI